MSLDLEDEQLFDWLESPNTKSLLAKAKAAHARALETLVGASIASKDPDVVRAAAMVRKFETLIEILGKGKFDG